MPKRIGKEPDKTEIVNKDIDEVLSNVAPEVLDSSITDPDIEEDKGPAFLMDEDNSDPTMTLNPKSLSEDRGMTPANLIQKKPGDGFKDTRDVHNPPKRYIREVKTAKPATEIDLENLDESKILEMPQIKAATFEVMDMLNLKPKDKSIRFRWVNWKNHVAGNMMNYIAKGFVTASKDDVDVERTPVHDSMLEGGTIKYYDIILMKIPVLRLMELYKANIIKSVNRLTKTRERGLREANRQFAADLQANSGMVAGYNKVKEGLGGKEPVEFYTPGMEDSNVVSR